MWIFSGTCTIISCSAELTGFTLQTMSSTSLLVFAGRARIFHDRWRADWTPISSCADAGGRGDLGTPVACRANRTSLLLGLCPGGRTIRPRWTRLWRIDSVTPVGTGTLTPSGCARCGSCGAVIPGFTRITAHRLGRGPVANRARLFCHPTSERVKGVQYVY